jgi:hypothetical protein
MSWITLTADDVQTVCTPQEIAVHRKLAKQSDNSDPVQKTIDQVVGIVRARVGGCSRNVLGPDGTIPDELRDATLDLIAARIPVGAGEDREKSAKVKEANELLKEVAACRYAIVPPAVAATNQPQQGGRITTVRRGRVRRRDEDMRGL